MSHGVVEPLPPPLSPITTIFVVVVLPLPPPSSPQQPPPPPASPAPPQPQLCLIDPPRATRCSPTPNTITNTYSVCYGWLRKVGCGVRVAVAVVVVVVVVVVGWTVREGVCVGDRGSGWARCRRRSSLAPCVGRWLGGAWWCVVGGGWVGGGFVGQVPRYSCASRLPLVRMRAFVGQALARADGFGLDAPELCPALTGLAWF